MGVGAGAGGVVLESEGGADGGAGGVRRGTRQGWQERKEGDAGQTTGLERPSSHGDVPAAV